MKINIGGQKPDAKPAETTSLADKASAFQFKKPEIVSSPQPAQSGGTVKPNPVSDKPNANNLLGTKAEAPKNEVASQTATPSNNIPEMADDKYEVVAGARDSFTEVAVYKFKQQ